MLSPGSAEKLPECIIFDKDSVTLCETIAMASYPRSGNTLLRTWIERVMGIWTGSDGANKSALH